MPPPSHACGGIQCANCGGVGHVYRVCNHPITSFGIICCRVQPDGSSPEYMLVQRKDSLCFVEFLRGKYNLQNRGYMQKLVSNMTSNERQRLRDLTFDELWYGFWQTDHTKTFMKEYQQSKARFDTLRNGYYLRPAQGGDLVFFNLEAVLAGAMPRYDEAEWGFPKGRRAINESDIGCACREFREETGIAVSDIQLVPGVKPFEEIFTGTNRVRYRHVYYLAALLAAEGAAAGSGVPYMPNLEPAQQREIQNVGWFDFHGVMAKIREENVERREMFRRVHGWVEGSSMLLPMQPPQAASSPSTASTASPASPASPASSEASAA